MLPLSRVPVANDCVEIESIKIISEKLEWGKQKKVYFTEIKICHCKCAKLTLKDHRLVRNTTIGLKLVKHVFSFIMRGSIVKYALSRQENHKMIKK